MRTQAQELARLAKALMVEIQKQEFLDSRTRINDYVDVYANDAKDYIHVRFNKDGKPVDITVHSYSSLHSETLSIDLSVTDEQLDAIVERSQTIVDEFIHIFANRSEEIRQERIAELEERLAILRGDV
jgi:hypothetical protein